MQNAELATSLFGWVFLLWFSAIRYWFYGGAGGLDLDYIKSIGCDVIIKCTMRALY